MLVNDKPIKSIESFESQTLNSTEFVQNPRISLQIYEEKYIWYRVYIGANDNDNVNTAENRNANTYRTIKPQFILCVSVHYRHDEVYTNQKSTN